MTLNNIHFIFMHLFKTLQEQTLIEIFYPLFSEEFIIKITFYFIEKFICQ